MLIRLAEQEKPHHIPVFTGEHYMFMDKEGLVVNRISGKAQEDIEDTKRRIVQMMVRSRKRLDDGDIEAIVRELSALWFTPPGELTIHQMRTALSYTIKPKLRRLFGRLPGGGKGK